MNRTKIEWAKNPDGTPGYTWNPITGCLNHDNGLCKGGGFPCYAYRLANGRLKSLYLANTNYTTPIENTGLLERTSFEGAYDPFYPRFWPERLKETKHGYKRNRGIFVCDMSDLFGIGIPEEWTSKVLSEIRDMWNMYARFYLLTKQPQNLPKWSPFPDNCFVGVTVCNNGAMTLALTNLANIQAKAKFISFEPLLGSIGVSDHMSIKGAVDWVIIGAQTKPYKPPKIEWVQEIVEAADRAGIPVFLKDNLESSKYESLGTMREPLYRRQGEYKTLELRQEMPQG